MEVAIGGNGSTPFQREVREWQRVDPNTGALLTGRLEADRWINGPLSAYGKVVDSKNVSQPNGTQHTQRKQFEVLQARTSSGSLQVVRAQTVQTSSSRWSSGTITTQSYDGQRFSSGLPLLTNGHNNHHNDAVITNGHDNIIHHQNHHQIQQKHHLNNISHLNSNLMAAPSLKLSTLMKNSNITNGNNNINGTTNGICNSDSSDGGDSIKSPHSSVSSSMSLVQRHQKHLHKSENETQSIQIVDGKFLQPTMIESRVGGCCNSIEQQSQNQQNLNHMEEFRNGIETSHLQRGRSISTDDLATTDWDPNDDGTEPSEWRRVSKIRRSFQFPKTITPPRESPSRPIDLPENSVSVSRIRQELENGRRLNTAMRNNHVDLVALDNILNGSPETAESLKEIRGKLKKLSDESLYKEDFITQSDLDKLNGTGSNGVQDGYAIEQPVVLQDSQVMKQQPSTFQIRPKPEINHTTNSLENRARYRDTTSAEWHLRRKSYGFEKMAPPPDNSMFCLETSTDSGIGRSGELSNWSSIENQPHSTVITFGDMNNVSKTTVKVVNGHESSSSSKPIVNRRYHHETKDITNRQETVEIKRHSIAVDESKYVRDNLRKVFDTKTSIHLNGLYSKDEINSSSQISVIDENGRRQKRVEFCKTEVHFAAESGRVNIVETDGKPPPTNNFRRRRRSSSNNSSISSAYLEAINSGVPVIHFGDEKKVLFEQETTIEESPKNNVTISIPIINNGNSEKTLTEEDEDPSSDEISLRGILKNKPIKPKPYHLGDNIESNDSLWGVRLKPVSSDFPMPKPKLLENDLHKTVSEQAIIDTENKEHSNIKKSVAERVRIVEERKDGSGYSTKINLNLSNSPYSWEIPETDTHLEVNKPIKLRLEETNTMSTTIPTTSSSSFLLNNSLPIRSNPAQSEILNEEGLKSTSLIMKTMRSANQFDEAMKRLKSNNNNNNNTNDINNHLTDSSASKLMISNINMISKSNSANSIFQDQINNITPSKYSSSLDGDFTINDESFHENQKIPSTLNYNHSMKSFNYDRLMNGLHENPIIKPMEILREESSSSTSINGNSLLNLQKPVAAPRIRIIGSSNAISHQLSQLRRMYDAADANITNDSDDDSAKADEEVKLYLSGGLMTQPSPEEKVSELSGSWSRVKVKRNNQKQLLKDENDEEVKAKELPKSNVMSIELHSPPSTFKKSSSSSTATIVPSRTDGPTAQNRSITSVKTTRSIEDESTGSNSYQTGSIRKIHNKLENCNNKIEKEPLKVVPGGARKLRDHELSYFGIKICNDNNTNNNEIKSNNQQQQQQQQNHKHRINTNNDTNRKLIIHNETNNNKWNTSSDNKPDLLKHSPIVSHKQQSSEQQQQKHTTIIENNGNIKITNHHNIEDDGPIYENLKKPSSYIRKKDLQRDEMNLSEMNQAADQALKAVSKDHSHKEHRHRSPQITSKPLDTIDEKRSTTKSSQQLQQQQHLIKVVKSTKPIQQQTSKHGVESFHRPCCSNRPSSASSNESLSRLSSSSSLRGSRSQDIKEKSDYDSTKSSKKRTSTIKDCTKVQRSNSRDTHRTQHASSSEDLAINPKIDIVRRVKRSKPKEKERTTPTTTKSDDHHRYKSSSIRSNTENDDRYNNRNVKKPEDQRRRSSKLSTESDDHTKMISSTRSSNDTRKSSSRHSSLMKTDKIAPSTTRSKISTTTTDPHKIRIKSSGIITGTTTTPSSTPMAGSQSKRSSREHNIRK